MNSTLLRFFCMILLGAGLYRAEAQCQYQLDLFDSFGDGWNGGSVKIVNGPNIYTFTLDNFSDDGMDSTVYFTVTAGLPLQLSWSPGFFVSEVSFKLYNTDNTLLYQSGVLGNSPVSLYSTIAACPSCLKPTNVQIENVYDTKAKLRWSPAPASSAIGWRVIYGPQGFVPGPGVGDTAFVTTPKVTLTGLQKKTGYDFYVVQQCDTTDFSAKVGPFSFETYWTNDVGISAVLSPVSSCALGQEAIKVVLTNYGAAPQTLLPFRYTVNGIDGGVQQPDDGFFTGVLGKDSSTVIEFETTFDFSEPGEYIIAVFTELTGDEESLNDTTYYRINNRLLAPYQQNFESWDGGWSVDTASVNPSWAFGDPEKFDLDTAASGVNAWLTSLDGLYNANEKSYLDSPCFDFSDLTTDPSIQFSLFYSTEANYDGGWLEMSLDGGTTWAKVGMQNEGLNWYNNTSSELGDVWDGQSGGWLQAQHRLPAAAGKSEVRLRFAMQADNFLSYSGLGIDDVRIFVTPANDLAALNVNTLGDADECGLAADSVTLRFTNLGTEPKSLFQVAYSLNGGQPVIETLGATIVVAPDEQFTYTFATPFDSRNGKFDIVGWTKLAGEQNFSNDTTAVYTVDHIPEPLPFKEDFEEGNFALPDGWYSTGFVTNFSNNISYVLEQNLYQFNTNYTTLLPRFGLVGADDSLRFDYRITDYPEGTDPTFLSNTVFEVQVSADCGPFENDLHHRFDYPYSFRRPQNHQFAAGAIRWKNHSDSVPGNLGRRRLFLRPGQR